MTFKKLVRSCESAWSRLTEYNQAENDRQFCAMKRAKARATVKLVPEQSSVYVMVKGVPVAKLSPNITLEEALKERQRIEDIVYEYWTES